jgi:hypothetical protein
VAPATPAVARVWIADVPIFCALTIIYQLTQVVEGYIGRCDEDAARAGIEWMRERDREAGQTQRGFNLGAPLRPLAK